MTEQVHASLLAQISTAHAATVHASIRRDGEWHFLSYTYELGHGARRVATNALGSHVQAFSDLVKTLAHSKEYREAVELLTQADRLMARAYDELLRKIQVAGETMFVEELKSDRDFWSTCESEWGQGPGYRDRVAAHNREWFNAQGHADLQRGVYATISREWSTTLERIRSIFDAG
jgi:hypothetical protein